MTTAVPKFQKLDAVPKELQEDPGAKLQKTVRPATRVALRTNENSFEKQTRKCSKSNHKCTCRIKEEAGKIQSASQREG